MISKPLFRTEEEQAISQPVSRRRLQQGLARERKRYVEAKLLAVIKEHPEGITLAEAAESLGVVPIILGRVVRRLQKRSKIHKANRFYFPTIRG